MRRQSRRWKPATRESNRSALKNQIMPASSMPTIGPVPDLSE